MKKYIVVIVICLAGAVGAYLWFAQESDANHNGDSCPKCKSTNVAVIAYGYYNLDYEDSTFKAKVKDGQIILGGCMVSDDSPTYTCRDCNYSWGKFRKSIFN